jgi:hypothetical protein
LQQKTLIAVLDGEGQRIRPAETARSIESPASSVRSALRALYDRGILWDDWNLRKLRVRLEDPFFAHWIRMRAILSLVGTIDYDPGYDVRRIRSLDRIEIDE